MALAAIISSGALKAQSTHEVVLDWSDGVAKTRQGFQQSPPGLFPGAFVSPTGVPQFVGQYPLRAGAVDAEVALVAPMLESVAASKYEMANELPLDMDLKVHVAFDRGKPIAVVSLYPLVRTSGGAMLERLNAFQLELTPIMGQAQGRAKSFASSSKLASGSWFKLGVTESGVYRLGYQDLIDLGVDVNALDPNDLNIYGSHFGQLPFSNSVDRPDDLGINAIEVVGGNDGSFDANDKVIFYASGPHTWSRDTDSPRFIHHKHLYSDSAYYFVGIGVDPPHRVQSLASTSDPANETVTSFVDYDFYERDWNNLIKTGRQFYGEFFDLVTTYNQSFNMPNIVQDEPVALVVDVISRTLGVSNSSSFNVQVGNMASSSFSISGISGSYTADYARVKQETISFLPTQSSIPITLTFNKHDPISSVAWLNYLEINATRELKMSGSQMQFRDTASVGVGNIADFQMASAQSVYRVWDITDPWNPLQLQYDQNGGDLSFRLATDSLREFVSFKNSGYKEPRLLGPVLNQNLHAIVPPVDMVIVSHGKFMAQAERLADHRRDEGLEVEVVNVKHVYNEFSSGARDITAIKWFMKMLYDRANNDPALMPKYLCLFGDGSYDNRSVASSNQNYIPTYQSLNSWAPIKSYVSDDYYGFLDDGDGQGLEDQMDIGVGRLVVSSAEQARQVVDKILNYDQLGLVNANIGHCNTESSGSAKDWRNLVGFVSDDQSGGDFDGQVHMSQSDQLAAKVETNHPEYNIEKIFLDAYQQETTPGGERYPEAQEALRTLVQQGLLLVNYVGHGGEVGWAHERILDNSTILNWTNRDQLPLFMTATCEFSRFDDPGRTSAGEYVLLNANGGGIALMTTTRLVFSSQNFALANKFYDHIFDETNGVPRLGDVSRKTKNASTSSSTTNHRNFSLLGDPAQRLAYPKHQVVLSALTDTAGNPLDTIRALSNVRVNGYVADMGGQQLNDFNGVVYPTIFDKAEEISTLANDPPGTPFQFDLQNKVIYKGKASVTDGQFQFDFIVPKDIAYDFGSGRASFYAESSDANAHGYSDDLIVGGSETNVADDDTGPLVELYLNDDSFVSGGLTDTEPIIYAKIFDENGVNTVGNSIGHDLVATLDGNTDEAIVLNDYYESDLDTYKSGTVRYQLDGIAPGTHQLKLKVWDVYNNSSEKEIEFVVSESEDLALDHVLNYPNPFTTRTEFWFEHNKVCSFLDVQVQVFTVSGKLVKTISERVQPEGFRADPIVWDGMDDYGDKLARGVYLYKLKVISPEGEKAEKIEKLVILN